ncbi:MAG TPA: type 1 glutamine amidotransferase [Methanomicrobiales archaeon]|nr:type 1 glutamine amidotransferase [Methanomicrobiales archaeon]
MKPVQTGGLEIALFQHMDSEGPGFFPDLFRARGMPFEIHRLYETGEPPPDIRSPLVILGGGMSVHDEREFPFIATEKEIIRRYLREGRPVVGICLGAQLIADAAGSRVYPGAREFGWCGIARESPEHFRKCPDRMEVFQFHGDTFDLPGGAVLLWKGREVKHQMFLLGSAAGVQFHPEITLPLIREWAKEHPARYIERLVAESSGKIPLSHAFCKELVDRFVLRGLG